MNKKVIAHEWLYLMGGVAVGTMVMVAMGDSLRNKNDFLTAVLVPYALFQMIRSILWAIKTINAK